MILPTLEFPMNVTFLIGKRPEMMMCVELLPQFLDGLSSVMNGLSKQIAGFTFLSEASQALSGHIKPKRIGQI